jgi:tetratricopeptide (TPR) repeat protein
VRALYRHGGTLRLLKTLIANDFGVIIEKGDFIVGEGWMGHYLTMQGYDDYASANGKSGVLYGMDTNRGPSSNGNGRPFSYEELDSRWRQFNRIFIVIYPAAREAELAQLLGNYADEEWAVRAALNTAQREASELGSDAYSWYNIGTNLTLLKDYKRAAAAYDQALKIGLEWRTFWYQFGQYEAWYNLGYYKEVLVQTDTTLQSTGDGKGLGLEEQHYWRGMVYAAEGDFTQAAREFETTLNWNKNFIPAQEALALVQTGRFQAPQIAQN